VFEVAGEKPQRADGPIAFAVPGRESSLKITIRQSGNPAHSVSQTITFPNATGERSNREKSFHAAALCLKRGLCAIEGPFSGDSHTTFAAFEAQPASIIAESSSTAYVAVPDLTSAGARPLIVAEEAKVVALPVTVGDFFIKNNGRELQSGQTLIVFPTLEGPGNIPQWRAGNFPAGNLARARQFVPDFHLAADGHSEADEDREGAAHDRDKDERDSESGEILVVVKNVTPDQISLRASSNNLLVFRLSEQSFERGDFKYDLLVEAKQAGKVDVKGYVIPFLAPISGQEFSRAAHR
jgi:hypothetical protein